MKDVDGENYNFMKYFYVTYKNKNLIELLSRAPHGQTMGYRKENGKINPIIDDSVKDYISEEKIRSRMIQFLEKEDKRPLHEYRNINFKGKIILYGAGTHGEYMYEY